MYEAFYGFNDKPFDLHPDPDYLYMSEGHEDAYLHLQYAIREAKGFVVVTGEIGSGKTTLINYLLRGLEQEVHVGLINNTTVSPQQFLAMVCQEFELETNGAMKPELLDAFNRYLLERFAANERVVLIVDEAQNLPLDTLEEIRLLSNLESEKHHLVQIILAGQPELRDKLQQKGLEQFVQRVTVHCHLEGLAREDVGRYVLHRLKVAGAEREDLFAPDALEAVYEYSRGVPRVINLLCDTALVFGFGDQLRTIDRDVIDSVAESRKIGGLAAQPVREPGAAAPSVLPGGPDAEARIRFLERRIRELEAELESQGEKMQDLARQDSQLLTALRAFNARNERMIEQILARVAAVARRAAQAAEEPPAEEPSPPRDPAPAPPPDNADTRGSFLRRVFGRGRDDGA